MPGRYDGYVGPREGGFAASARGETFGIYPTQEEAAAVVMERAAGAPCWYVDEDGRTTPLMDVLL